MHIVSPRANGALRFHLGEQITVAWQVPRHHSRRDWIGLYRVGANPSSLVTRTSSLGMWMPVHDEEWDGEFPISEDSHLSSPMGSEGAEDEASGTVVFQGDGLPWTVGRYEVRYHHDGMYNVLALDGPIELYGVSTPPPFLMLSSHAPIQWTAQRKSTLIRYARRSLMSSHCASTVTRHWFRAPRLRVRAQTMVTPTTSGSGLSGRHGGSHVRCGRCLGLSTRLTS